MTIQDIKDVVARIESLTHDPEVAHATEDSLYTEVLQAIARGAPDAQALAVETLKTANIKFPRWCA